MCICVSRYVYAEDIVLLTSGRILDISYKWEQMETFEIARRNKQYVVQIETVEKC